MFRFPIVINEAKKQAIGFLVGQVMRQTKGKADGDGMVTLGELMDYVDITVRRETANEQHPARAGVQFDRKLPMGIVK